MRVKAVCFTSDKGNPYLKGFIHQWKKYSGIALDIVGFTKPEFELFPGEFFSMGAFKDYPAARWSNAIRLYLDQYCNADIVWVMLEDYWLIRAVNFDVIGESIRYMLENKDVLRCDLTTDRVYSGAIIRDFHLPERECPVDFIETDPTAAYSLSLQASLWNVNNFRWMLRADESPWDFEIQGTARVGASGLRVIGTRQNPVNYLIACNKGKFDPSGEWMFPPRTLTFMDWQELKALDLLP